MFKPIFFSVVGGVAGLFLYDSYMKVAKSLSQSLAKDSSESKEKLHKINEINRKKDKILKWAWIFQPEDVVQRVFWWEEAKGFYDTEVEGKK